MLKNVLSRALSGAKSHVTSLDNEVTTISQQIAANQSAIERLAAENLKLERKAKRHKTLAGLIHSAVAKFEAEDEGE